ncbi:MAG: hypothetical protein N2321_04080 [Melioribacteraceae bacterium]|nr:hypothetical protein [Melioribacteraceae bacterium]
MKKNMIMILTIILLAYNNFNAKPNFDISFNVFYSSLKNYGEWIEIDRDLYAWRPVYVSHLWKPYTRGRWIWSSFGWYWDSYEPFGWAVYHYGRWYYDDYYGWIWIPDYEWGPAWVEWRYNDNYIGWAPLPPYASFHISFGIRFSIGWTASYHWWNFVPYRRFCDHRIDYYILDHRRVERIYGTTKYRNNYYFDRDRIINGGIDKEFVERKAGYRIAEREIRTVNDRNEFEKYRKENSDRIISYRPNEREFDNNNQRFEVKRSERKTTLERDKIFSSEITRTENRDVIERKRKNDDFEFRDKEIERNNNERNYPDNIRQIESKRNNEREKVYNEFKRPQTERENWRTPERKIEQRSERNEQRPEFRYENKSERNENRGSVERNSNREPSRSTERRR